MHVDPAKRQIVSYDERVIDYDLLVTIPTNMGDSVIARSGWSPGTPWPRSPWGTKPPCR